FLHCTFEDYNKCSFQTIASNVNANWKIIQGLITSFKTVDHTTKTLEGHFFAVDISDTSGGKIINGETRTASPVFNPTKGTCVTFSYLMRGLNQTQQLQFFIKKSGEVDYKPLWFVAGEQGPFWYTHRRNVVSDKNWQIVFGAVLKNAIDGIIGIDDLMVEVDKSCPQARRCDFEREDTCLWESIPASLNSIARDQKLRWS